MCGGHIWVWGRRKRSIWPHGCLQTKKQHWGARITLKKKSTGQGMPGNTWNVWDVSPLLSQGIVVEILLRALHLFGKKRPEEGDGASWASCGAFISWPFQFSVGKSAGMKIRNKTYGYAFLGKVSQHCSPEYCVTVYGLSLFCVSSVSSAGLAFSHATLGEKELKTKQTTHFTVETSVESTSLK